MSQFHCFPLISCWPTMSRFWMPLWQGTSISTPFLRKLRWLFCLFSNRMSVMNTNTPPPPAWPLGDGNASAAADSSSGLRSHITVEHERKMDSRRQNGGASELRGAAIRVRSKGPCVPQRLREAAGPPRQGCVVCVGHMAPQFSATVEMSRTVRRGH